MPSTVLSDLINPQVMADMISAKVAQKLVVAPFAKVDNTLVGRPGDTITIPQYAYIGDEHMQAVKAIYPREYEAVIQMIREA